MKSIAHNPKKGKGFTKLENDVAECMSNLPAGALKVYMHLRSRDKKGTKNYQGTFGKMKTIAEACGYKSKSSVSEYVSMLEYFGWIKTKPAGVKRMPNGKTVKMDCFEYEFIFPRDADGNLKLSPTVEQMKEYRGGKSKEVISDDAILEEEILEQETEVKRGHLPNEYSETADRILAKLKLFNSVIADDKLQRDALGQLVGLIEQETITMNDIVYCAEDVSENLKQAVIRPTTILNHVGKYCISAKGCFNGNWFGWNQTKRPELYDYDEQDEFVGWQKQMNGIRKAFLNATLPQDEWKTFSFFASAELKTITLDDWIRIRAEWRAMVDALKVECVYVADLDTVKERAARRLLYGEPFPKEEFEWDKQFHAQLANGVPIVKALFGSSWSSDNASNMFGFPNR